MIVLQSACLQGVAFDSDLIGFRGAARECQTESEPGDTTCFAKLFTGLG